MLQAHPQSDATWMKRSNRIKEETTMNDIYTTQISESIESLILN